MKKKLLNIIEIILVLIIAFVCIISIYDIGNADSKYKILTLVSDFLSNKINFIISIFIPFVFLIILELKRYNYVLKKKELEYKMNVEVENLEIKNEEKTLEETILEAKKAEMKNSSEDFENTINIPLEEIQEQVKRINNKDTIEDDTMILFTKDDIKNAIKKELETKKGKKNYNKQAKK